VSVAAGLDGFGAISPELVLVSPPEVRDRVLELLPTPERWAAKAPVEFARSVRGLPFAVFCGACAAMTLAPLALIVVAH
jgi:hypothetical protein